MKHNVVFFFSWIALSGCQETGTVMRDSGPGGRDTGGPGVDSSMPPPATFSYTPEGCGYVVRAPDVDDPAMGSDAGTGAPDHIHVSWSGPTDSTFAVNWRSDAATLLTQVLYGTDEAMVMAADGASGTDVRMQAGHTFSYEPLAGAPTRIHEVHVCGLTPGTQWFYKVGGPGHWSDVYDVTTGPATGTAAPFVFAVTGDSRNEPAIFAAVQERVAMAAPDFQLFSGDAVVLGANQGEWDDFFEARSGSFEVTDLLARSPFMVANGNHDSLALPYVAQFALPQEVTEGERGEGEEWYSFDYGNAHFVFLNDTATSALITGAQANWLEADLMAVDRATTPWVFVVHHKPMYSCATAHGSDTTLRSNWQSIYDRFQVDFVFNGHDHDYERSKPIRGFGPDGMTGNIAETGPMGIPVSGSGTVYVVAAGAGAPLYGVDPSCYHTQITESVVNYLIVGVDGDTITFDAYRMDGSVIDTFEYTK